MLNLRESLERFAADALGWRIGRDEVGKFRFKIDQLLVKPVIFAVADGWRGFLVITPVVFADHPPQLGDSLCRLSLVFGHEP